MFQAGEEQDNRSFQPDEQNRDENMAAGDAAMPSAMAVSSSSVRNPNIETLGDLLTDDETGSSKQVFFCLWRQWHRKIAYGCCVSFELQITATWRFIPSAACEETER
jgi:hypothetical protein